MPKSIAVIGASHDSKKIGYEIMRNLIKGGFKGKIYPINPKADKILDKKVYKSVTEVPAAPDLAVIVIPSPFVKDVMIECGKKGVKSVAVITSGFGEIGKVKLENELKQIADKYQMSLFGPNIFGIINSPAKLNASFGLPSYFPGNIAFITQSGALGIGLMGWTSMEKVGLSSVVSLGNKADVTEKELIEYFNNDDNVDVVMIYMEGIKNPIEFLKTKIKKPVIVLKSGRSEKGSKAVASHTGSLAGADKIYSAVFDQMGIMRANSFDEAFGWAVAMSQPKPKGEETVIITNGGGIGVLATDECETHGIKLLDDKKYLEQKFRKTMPEFGSASNPIDITGQGGDVQFRNAARIAFAESRIKSVIFLYCETSVTDPMAIATAIYEEHKSAGSNKPVSVCFLGGERSKLAIKLLNENKIPASSSVPIAVSSLAAVYKWHEIKSSKKEKVSKPRLVGAGKKYVDSVKKQKKSFLLEHESRQILESAGIKFPKSVFAKSVSDAVKQAKNIYPLAMKIASPDIIHKSDVGGVKINIKNEKELRTEYREMMKRVKKNKPKAKITGVNLVQMMKGLECVVGLNEDPQFGPVVMFGLGGVYVEVLKDVSFRVVPFGKMEAEKMISDLKTSQLFEGFRGMKVKKQDIIKTLLNIQKLAGVTKEVDINPLIVNEKGAFAVDARVIL